MIRLFVIEEFDMKPNVFIIFPHFSYIIYCVEQVETFKPLKVEFLAKSLGLYFSIPLGPVVQKLISLTLKRNVNINYRKFLNSLLKVVILVYEHLKLSFGITNFLKFELYRNTETKTVG